MTALESVYGQQKRSQFGTSTLNTDGVQDQLSSLNAQAENRRQAGVRSGMRVMNQQTGIGGQFNQRGSQGINGNKYPTRAEIEAFQN